MFGTPVFSSQYKEEEEERGGGDSVKQADRVTETQSSDLSLPLQSLPYYNGSRWAFSMEEEIDFYKHFTWLKKVG